METKNEDIDFVDLDGQLDDSDMSFEDANSVLDNLDSDLKATKAEGESEEEFSFLDMDDKPDNEEEDDDVDDKKDPDADDSDEGDEDDEGDGDADAEEKDAEEEPDEEVEDEEEKLLKGYDPKVQKRIRRELKAKQEAMAETIAVRQEMEQMKAQLAEQQKATRNSTIMAYNALADRNAKDLVEAKAKATRAHEDGETEAYIDLQMEYNRLHAEKRDIDSKKHLFAEGAAPPVGETTPAPKTNNQNGVTAEGNKWIQRNPWLFDSTPLAVKAREIAQDIDNSRTIKADPNTPEYFDELNKQLKGYFPQLKVQSTREPRESVRRKSKKTKSKSQVGGVNNRSSGGNTGGKVKLDKGDYAMMRELGYDPKTAPKEFLAEWARNKRNAQ